LGYFKKNGGNFEIKDVNGDTALTFLLKNMEKNNPDLERMAEILNHLAAHGANLNFVNDDGDSGLLILAKFAVRQSGDAYPKTRALFIPTSSKRGFHSPTCRGGAPRPDGRCKGVARSGEPSRAR